MLSPTAPAPPAGRDDSARVLDQVVMPASRHASSGGSGPIPNRSSVLIWIGRVITATQRDTNRRRREGPQGVEVLKSRMADRNAWTSVYMASSFVDVNAMTFVRILAA